MQISLCVAISLNGKITHGKNGLDWISREDQKRLKRMIGDNDVLVMGRETFDQFKNKFDLSNSKLRIILTKNPKKFSHYSTPDKLEFFKNNPRKIITQLARRGYVKILILGGSIIFGEFIKEKLIDELLVTIEPVIIGNGLNFTSFFENNCNLTLLKIKKLNSNGTILLHYKKH